MKEELDIQQTVSITQLDTDYKRIKSITISPFGAIVPADRTINGLPLTDNISLVKTDIGLDQVDNTPDTAKPISEAQRAALNAKADVIRVSPSGKRWRTSIDDDGNHVAEEITD